MNREKIKNLLDHHVPEPLGLDHRFSVLCPLIDVDGETHVLFEKRSLHLSSHTGEVSLPGGRIEEGETPREAAFRETIEELRIDPAHLTILGEGNYLVARNNRAVHVFIGTLEGIAVEDISPEPGEVAYVFTVPLSVFLNTEPEEHIIEFKKDRDDGFPYDLIPQTTVAPFRNIKDRIFFYKEAKEKEQIVWGMTAKIMRDVGKLLRKTITN